MENHTALPWKIGLYDASVAFTKVGVHVAVCKPDLSLIATCGPANDAPSEADAAFITKSANYHHKLVYQLKKSIHQLRMRKDRTAKENEVIATSEKLLVELDD